MDDMNAFERQVAGESEWLLGPERSVDDAEVFRATIMAARSPRWRFQSMISATRFVVAGVIVALFGGSLVAGVLTQPSDEQLPAVGASASAQAERTAAVSTEPDPTAELRLDDAFATADLLPGVDPVTEEVEPGVHRVVSDGVRDMTMRDGRYVVGRDGSLWLFRDKEFFRVGDAETHEWSNDGKQDLAGLSADDIEVGPDGVVWWADVDGDGLKSFDGRAWTMRRKKPTSAAGKVTEVEVLEDGTVLASWKPSGRTDDNRKVARLGPDGWEVLGSVPGISRAQLAADDMDAIWLLLDGGDTIDYLYRGTYRPEAEGGIDLMERPEGHIRAMDLGADGTLWLMLGDSLARFDGSEWQRYPVPDELFSRDGWTTLVRAAPDGSAWLDICGVATDEGQPCHPARFDGRTFNEFEGLSGLRPIDFAPDGTSWMLAAGEPGLYVITPQAMTARD